MYSSKNQSATWATSTSFPSVIRTKPSRAHSVYLAPLSAYNYRFVRYGQLAVAHYGIREGRHHYEDFGTKLEVNATLNLLKNFSWKTRLYYYTTYSRVEHDWENTFTFSFNKHFSRNILNCQDKIKINIKNKGEK